MSEAQMVNGVEITPLTSWDDLPVPATDLNANNDPEVGEIVDGKLQEDTETDMEAVALAAENSAEPIEEIPEEDIESSKEVDDINSEEDAQETRPLKEILEELGIDTKSIKVAHKQNGKDAELSLDEVINKGFGTDAVEKQFSSLNEEKKVFASEKAEHLQNVDQVNSYINGFREQYNTENGVLGAFQYIGELAGAPGYEIKEKLIAALLPEIEARYEKSEEQLNLEYKSAQAEYKLGKAEERENTVNVKQAQQDLNVKIQDLKKESAITDEEWTKAYEALDGRLDSSYKEIPLDMVTNEVNSNRVHVQAESIVGSINKSLVRADVIQTTQEIMIANPDFTEADIKGIIKEAYQDEVKAKAGKKISAKAKPKMVKKPVTKTPDKPDMSAAERAWHGI